MKEKTNYPTVEIRNVENLKVTFAKGSAKVSFETKTPGPDMLKLVHFQGMGNSLNVSIESPQAEFDLLIQTVSTKTGLVIEARDSPGGQRRRHTGLAERQPLADVNRQ